VCRVRAGMPIGCFAGREPPLALIQRSEMSEPIHLPVGIAPDPEGQQTGVRRRVKRRASRRNRSLAGRRLTRLAGLLWPGHARSRRQEAIVSAPAPPTERQLRYLRTLASRTATTFARPLTRRQASSEIDRLIALSRSEATAPYDNGADGEEPTEYATAVRADEVSGFGSSARWRSQPHAEARNTRPPHPAQRPVPLRTYRVSAGDRVLIAERSGEEISVRDVPACGDGVSYAVEQLSVREGAPALRALLADYLRRARELDEIPMAHHALAQMLHAGGKR
jgi:hypothetical protein